MATVATAKSSAPSRLRRKTMSRRFESAGPFTYLFLLGVAILSIFPLYWSVVVASHDNSAIANYPPSMTPGRELFHNIGRVFNSGEVNISFWTALINSALVSGVIAFSVVLFSCLAGFAFAKLQFRGNKLLMMVVIGTLIVPVQLGVIPLYIEMRHLGLIPSGSPGAHAIWAVVMPSLASAFGVFLMRQYIVSSVPNELIDASRVDGCHTFRVFWHVVLPAVRPAAAVLGLLTFMNAWNDFFWPLVVLTPQNPTVQVAVSTLQSGYVQDYSLVFAGTFISILPLIAIFLVLGRQIIGGIMKGAVKG
jgi:cellobiose transport system permease protein